jgi:hypothetical protein
MKIYVWEHLSDEYGGQDTMFFAISNKGVEIAKKYLDNCKMEDFYYEEDWKIARETEPLVTEVGEGIYGTF